MNTKQIDILYISHPMSEVERIQMLNGWKEEIFLRGIDKGTVLEKINRERLFRLKEKALKKKFEVIIENINEYIYVGVKRHGRKKYRGRYSDQIEVSFSKPANSAPWLKY